MIPYLLLLKDNPCLLMLHLEKTLEDTKVEKEIKSGSVESPEGGIKLRKSQKSIKKTLLGGIIGLAVVISVFCGIANAIVLYNEARNNMNTRLVENRNAYCLAIEKAINIYRVQVEAFAQNEIITDTTKPLEERNKVMAELAEKNGFMEVTVTDSNGKSTSCADFSEREYFKESMAGKTYLSSTLVSSIDG